jgi:hypothetical protein
MAGQPVRAGCTWGQLAGDDPVLGVQIASPNGGAIDPLKQALLPAGKPVPSDVAPGAQLYDKALIPFGGGDGHSIAWTHDGKTILVGMVRGTKAKVEAAAKAVNAKLG